MRIYANYDNFAVLSFLLCVSFLEAMSATLCSCPSLRRQWRIRDQIVSHIFSGKASPVNLGHRYGSVFIFGYSKLNKPRVGAADIVNDLRAPMDNDAFIPTNVI